MHDVRGRKRLEASPSAEGTKRQWLPSLVRSHSTDHRLEKRLYRIRCGIAQADAQRGRREAILSENSGPDIGAHESGDNVASGAENIRTNCHSIQLATLVRESKGTKSLVERQRCGEQNTRSRPSRSLADKRGTGGCTGSRGGRLCGRCAHRKTQRDGYNLSYSQGSLAFNPNLYLGCCTAQRKCGRGVIVLSGSAEYCFPMENIVSA